MKPVLFSLLSVLLIYSCGSGSNPPESKTEAPTSESSIESTKIGAQVWMVKNLEVASFQNGDPIPQAKTAKDWVKANEAKQPAWCYYKNNPANGNPGGKLYNWYAVNDSRGIAPEGWRVASKEDWDILLDTIARKNNTNNDISAPRIMSEQGWKDGRNGINDTGFTAIPVGTRQPDGSFLGRSESTSWWTSSVSGPGDAHYTGLFYEDRTIWTEWGAFGNGFSVRCVKD